MSKSMARVFSREQKLLALSRMVAGENVSALARELGLRRKLLYRWREQFRAGGPEALRTRGRPRKAGPAMGPAPPGSGSPGSGLAGAAGDELAQAKRRIAELERKIGRQQLELDFFQQALRQVREARPRSGVPGGTAFTGSSKR